MLCGGARFPRGRAEPAPPREARPARMALRGRPGDNAKGDSLGWTRSARPPGKAGPKPRHNIIIGDNRTPGGLVGAILRCKQGLVYGRAEPAPPGGTSPAWMAVRGKARDAAKGVFSEGRTLCARIERPSPCRGISLAEMARRAARAPIGRCPDEARAFLPGVRSPPLRGGLAQHGWPCGERSEMTPRESSRRGAVSAPVWQGRTLARVWHDQRGVGERPVA